MHPLGRVGQPREVAQVHPVITSVAPYCPPDSRDRRRPRVPLPNAPLYGTRRPAGILKPADKVRFTEADASPATCR